MEVSRHVNTTTHQECEPSLVWVQSVTYLSVSLVICEALVQQQLCLSAAGMSRGMCRVARSFFCEEVGVVKGVHLLSGEVRIVTTALKVVEEVQEEVQEIEDG